ncbi:prepilin-type N-terminal cleavage/methylation domain-containing protein [Candidatus Berkelbacteria bacterium]|nr:prepilin-type N-terminal cleavage/methylation domain-containing protein [Candidatus Berkelbacteria bacterium]
MNRGYERGKTHQRATRGFTLIELLTVIAIIGILTTVVTVNVSSSRRQARDARRKTDLKTIQTAVELYTNAKGEPPQSETWLTSNGGSGTQWITGLENYLSSVPQDPRNDETYYYRYKSGKSGFETSYAIDGVLEEQGVGNLNPSNFDEDDNGKATFFQTGTYTSVDGKLHQRFSSGAGQ